MSFATQMLERVQAELLRRLDPDAEGLNLAEDRSAFGRQVRVMSTTALATLEKELQARVAAESSGGGKLKASFRRPA